VSDLVRVLAPDARLLCAAIAVDLILGDPVYPAHPVRLMGGTLRWFEARLRAAGFDGYGGGVCLFVCLASIWLTIFVAFLAMAVLIAPAAAAWLHALMVYSLLALGDLLHHVWRIESAVRRNAIDGARRAVGALVGRDTDRLDGAACRRAAVESLSENLTDGFVSPVCWYIAGGVPALVLFKIVSTMDSMVGYKTADYLRFGWCGARLDDLMNYLPARLTWIVIAGVALVLPGLSGRKAWRVGLHQHAVLLGPNSGWSEAAAAGALERRIVGPIWLKGVQVTDLWVGDPADPPLSTHEDVVRAMSLTLGAGVAVALLSAALLSGWSPVRGDWFTARF
jgi:adenosylcobinamide-phosphate synthase